uniref:PWWP domain-containing protein n=1 Tax=Gopherus evgoodei TaxID=1825980 RepID=A0A8C4W6P0_9SAUR
VGGDTRHPATPLQRIAQATEGYHSNSLIFSVSTISSVSLSFPPPPPHLGYLSSLRQKPLAHMLFQAGLNLHEMKLKEENDLESLAPIQCSKRRMAMSVQVPLIDLAEEDSKESSQSSNTVSASSTQKDQNRSPELIAGKQESRVAGEVVEYKDGKDFGIEELMWGKIKGFSWWPAIMVFYRVMSKCQAISRMCWVSADKLVDLTVFRQNFSHSMFNKLVSRSWAGKTFPEPPLLQMLLWRMLGGLSRSSYLGQGKRARPLELLHVSTAEVLWGVTALTRLECTAAILHQ